MEISVVCIKGKEVFRMGKSFAMWYILLIHGSLFFVFLVYGMRGKAIRKILRGLQKDVLKRMNKAVFFNKNGGRRDENKKGSV